MENWIAFWKWVCVGGAVSFYAVFLLLVPLGARDIFRLFKTLDRRRNSDIQESESEDNQQLN